MSTLRFQEDVNEGNEWRVCWEGSGVGPGAAQVHVARREYDAQLTAQPSRGQVHSENDVRRYTPPTTVVPLHGKFENSDFRMQWFLP